MISIKAFYRTIRRGDYETVPANSANVAKSAFGRGAARRDADNTHERNYNNTDISDRRWVGDWKGADGYQVTGQIVQSERVAFTGDRQSKNAGPVGAVRQKEARSMGKALLYSARVEACRAESDTSAQSPWTSRERNSRT